MWAVVQVARFLLPVASVSGQLPWSIAAAFAWYSTQSVAALDSRRVGECLAVLVPWPATHAAVGVRAAMTRPRPSV